MPERITSAVTLAAEINRITCATRGSPRELVGLWALLAEILPFSAAWLGVLDASGRRFLTAGAVGHDPPARAYFESRAYYVEMESAGMWQHRQPMCLRSGGRPPTCPTADQLWWPNGRHDGIGMPLITTDGRPVGLLVLLTDATGHTRDAGCEVLGEAAPMIAAAIDPMASAIGLAGLVVDACASAVVGSGGGVYPLPGSPLHPLLASGGKVVAMAVDRLRTHESLTAFLCPYPGHHSDDYLRVTVIACPPIPTSPFAVLLILSAAGDLHGLTRRELEVLGLVIDGMSNRAIASLLFITQRTVAAHLEHIRSKLDVPTRTAAAVQALDHTLYVPHQLAGTDD